jgi:hypothetical protein
MFTSTSYNEGIKWRIDEDGFMRVTMCVLRSGVFEYAKKDMPEEVTRTAPDKEVWRLNINGDYSPDFLKSVEAKPVIIYNHDWQEVGKIEADDIKGAIAGSASVEGGSIIVDGVITDAKTIELIQSGKLVDVSAGYNSEVSVSDSPDYDAEQIPSNANHFVLLPKGEGRCGPTVRILNKKEETTMVKVKITNSSGKDAEYQFTNEADAAMAESMVKENAADGTAQMEAKNHELATAQARFAEIDQVLSALNAEKMLLEQKLKEYESEEYQESQMAERAAYKSDETAVIENSLDEEQKKAVEAKLQNAKSVKDRKAIVTTHICNAKGIPCAESDVNGIFAVLCKTMNKASVTEIRKPTEVRTVNSKDNHPIFHRG